MKISYLIAVPFLVLSLWSTWTLAEKMTIRGKGASTLFVCDEKAVFECWFALRHSYCEIDVGVDFELTSEIPARLAVWGAIGEQIWKVTHNCSDGDRNFPYWYGREGVNCEVLASGNHKCWLEIDAIY